MSDQILRDKVASLRRDADALESVLNKAKEAAEAPKADEWSGAVEAAREEAKALDLRKEPSWRSTPRITALLDKDSDVSKGLTERQRFARVAAYAAATIRSIDSPGC